MGLEKLDKRKKQMSFMNVPISIICPSKVNTFFRSADTDQ